MFYTNGGFPGGSVVKNPPANAGDTGLIPGWGRSPEGENGNPLQYSCLGSPMDRGTWRATVHGVIRESDTLVSTYSIVMHRVFELRRLIFWQVLGAPERKMLSVWHEQSSLLGSVFFFFM